MPLTFLFEYEFAFLRFQTMMRILILTSLFIPLHAMSMPSNIAVVDFPPTNGVAASEVQMIADRLEVELIKTNAYKVLERRQISTILAEQGFQGSGACEAAQCQVQMGQLLGVDQIVAGSVGKVGSVYSMTVKLVDVASGAILFSHAIDVKGDLSEVLTEGCHSMAQKMSKGRDGLTSNGTESEKKLKPWWIAGGITALAAIGVGSFIALRPRETKTEVVDRSRLLGEPK